MRLVKYLAHSGVASRRKSEEIIRAGRVKIHGAVVTDPARGVEMGDDVRVDGSLVQPEGREVWAVNKPVGVVSTASEPGHRRAVVELVNSTARLYPVGRLDVDSCGLMLLSNDGELANRLTHPRYEVPKTYEVELRHVEGRNQFERLREGVVLEDGKTAPADVRQTGERSIEITSHEGRNRQIRRMVEAVGNEVVALKRISMGPVKLGRLGNGKARLLSEEEVARLWENAGNE